VNGRLSRPVYHFFHLKTSRFIEITNSYRV
jgi:hypothetical protein